jgi:GNAT superfamily N-acetyltransferase
MLRDLRRFGYVREMRARAGTLEDYPNFVRFFAWLGVPDPTPTPEWYGLYVGKDSVTFVIDENEQPIAYSIAFPLGAGLAYVLHVVVDPNVRNRGVGRFLMQANAERLRAQGCTEWSLSVLVTNAAAITLYRRCGMEIQYPTESLQLPWTSVELLPHEPIAVEELDPAKGPEIERALGLPAGRVARAVEVPGRVGRSAPNGVIVFDPAFPGCPLFRASTPAMTRALLESVREFRKPEHDSLRVTVENNPELAKALLAIGGKTVLSLVNMRGPL